MNFPDRFSTFPRLTLAELPKKTVFQKTYEISGLIIDRRIYGKKRRRLDEVVLVLLGLTGLAFFYKRWSGPGAVALSYRTSTVELGDVR